MFKITNEWLDKHRTKNGGWTKAQVKILHDNWPTFDYFKWPMKKGWKKFIIGKNLNYATKFNFESSANVTCKTKNKFNVNLDLAILKDQLKWAYCEKIGSDSIIGLDSCDNYKNWLLTLIK